MIEWYDYKIPDADREYLARAMHRVDLLSQDFPTEMKEVRSCALGAVFARKVPIQVLNRLKAVRTAVVERQEQLRSQQEDTPFCPEQVPPIVAISNLPVWDEETAERTTTAIHHSLNFTSTGVDQHNVCAQHFFNLHTDTGTHTQLMHHDLYDSATMNLLLIRSGSVRHITTNFEPRNDNKVGIKGASKVKVDEGLYLYIEAPGAVIFSDDHYRHGRCNWKPDEPLVVDRVLSQRNVSKFKKPPLDWREKLEAANSIANQATKGI